MVIEIDLRAEPPAVNLREPDDFGAFKVVGLAGENDDARCAQALRRIGTVDEDGRVFIAVETLLALAGDHAHEPRWLASLDGMQAYARAHEWTDPTGAIQGHVEWIP
jgi:hypothetical protein